MDRYKLIFTVPVPAAEKVKNAIFKVGAGMFPGGKYSHVCFQTAGVGQFLPEEDRGANPHIGTPGVLERVEELKVEILCVTRDVVLDAVDALKKWVESIYVCIKTNIVKRASLRRAGIRSLQDGCRMKHIPKHDK